MLAGASSGNSSSSWLCGVRECVLLLAVAVIVVAMYPQVAVAQKMSRAHGGVSGAERSGLGFRPHIGGPFTLIDDAGNRVTQADYEGRYLLVYFGYTHCTDTCPTVERKISSALDLLGARAGQVQPLFITVDPRRDRPTVLAKWLSKIDPRIVGLTGSARQIAAVAREYQVAYSESASRERGGLENVEHSSFIYLMSPHDKFVTYFYAGATPQEIASKVKLILRRAKAGAHG